MLQPGNEQNFQLNSPSPVAGSRQTHGRAILLHRPTSESLVVRHEPVCVVFSVQVVVVVVACLSSSSSSSSIDWSSLILISVSSTAGA